MLANFGKNCRWLFVFWIYCTIFLALSCLPFVICDSESTYLASQVAYLGATQYGWFGVICLVLSVLCFLFSWLPRSWFKIAVFVVFEIALLVLNVDLVVFEHYKFHINAILINMFFQAGREIFNVSWFSYLVFLLIHGIYVLGLLATFWCADRFEKLWRNLLFIPLWIAALLFSQGLYAYHNACFSIKYSQFNNRFPVYYPITAKRFLYNNGYVDRKVAEKNRTNIELPSTHTAINYPLSEMVLTPKKNLPNILFLFIDAWRPEDVNEKVMPTLSNFVKKASHFTEHRSGGNCTQPGLFSLFYSLPSTYWDSFYGVRKAPVFFDALIDAGYQFKILSSATLTSPPLVQTAFKNIPDLRITTPGSNQVERDQKVTVDFEDFMETKNNDQPYFSFIFYDSAHGTEFPDEYALFKPYWERVDHISLNNNFDGELYHNRYRNSLRFIDDLIKRVLNKVDLENTIVVVSSDHGEEFNENKKNFWGHSGNYSDYQIKVPMYVYVPHREAKTYHHRTNHYDVVPTILNYLFDVKTPTADYAVGRDLLDQTPRDWFICGSYYNYAIVGKDKLFVTYPGGAYQLMDTHLNSLEDEKFPVAVLKEQVELMSKFFK